MALTPSLITLRERASSEAKRTGATSPRLEHLALACYLSDSERFEQEIGVFPKERLLELAKVSSTVESGEAGTVVDRVLESAAETDDPFGFLLQEVGTYIRSSSEEGASEPTATETQVSAEPDKRVSVNPDLEAQSSVPLSTQVRAFVEQVEADSSVIGRDQEVNLLLTHLGRQKPATPCVVGSAGSGRTSLFKAVAARLSSTDYEGPLKGWPVFRVAAEQVIAAARSNALRRIVQELKNKEMLIALDDLEVLTGLGDHSADLDMLGVVRSLVGTDKPRFAFVISSEFVNKLNTHAKELADRLSFLELTPLSSATLLEIARTKASELASHHNIEIEHSAAAAAASAPSGRAELAQPGLLLERLMSPAQGPSSRG